MTIQEKYPYILAAYFINSNPKDYTCYACQAKDRKLVWYYLQSIDYLSRPFYVSWDWKPKDKNSDYILIPARKYEKKTMKQQIQQHKKFTQEMEELL